MAVMACIYLLRSKLVAAGVLVLFNVIIIPLWLLINKIRGCEVSQKVLKSDF